MIASMRQTIWHYRKRKGALAGREKESVSIEVKPCDQPEPTSFDDTVSALEIGGPMTRKRKAEEKKKVEIKPMELSQTSRNRRTKGVDERFTVDVHSEASKAEMDKNHRFTKFPSNGTSGTTAREQRLVNRQARESRPEQYSDPLALSSEAQIDQSSILILWPLRQRHK
uniref:Uncharacterized protein n=1 Tax=Steinernema glaseri TaxID=37863 RepID=A0A1I7Y927_9BILA